MYTPESQRRKSSMDNSSSGALAAGLIVYFIFMLAATAFGIFVMWRILSRAGYSGALSFLMLIPGIGALIIFLMLAFGEWPILRELNMLRQQRGMMPPGYPQGPQGPYAPNPQYPPTPQYPGNAPYPSSPQYPPSNPQYPQY
jgi:hypothetical protein